MPIPDKLCLYCENFILNVGFEGYSEYTPGSDFSMYCNLNHFKYESRSTEEHYRACLETAMHCKDYKERVTPA